VRFHCFEFVHVRRWAPHSSWVSIPFICYAHSFEFPCPTQPTFGKKHPHHICLGRLLRNKIACQIWGLTLAMLGSQSSPIFQAKAAETHNLVEFITITLDRRMPAYIARPDDTGFKAQLLCECGKSMCAFNAILSENDRHMTHQHQLQLASLFMMAFTCFSRAGGALKPKWHLMLHCIQKITFFGNPRFYWTYKDEGTNGVLAKIARSCHRRFWQEAVHNKFACCKQLGLAKMH
jgi:hypothetical protein